MLLIELNTCIDTCIEPRIAFRVQTNPSLWKGNRLLSGQTFNYQKGIYVHVWLECGGNKHKRSSMEQLQVSATHSVTLEALQGYFIDSQRAFQFPRPRQYTNILSISHFLPQTIMIK